MIRDYGLHNFIPQQQIEQVSSFHYDAEDKYTVSIMSPAFSPTGGDRAFERYDLSESVKKKIDFSPHLRHSFKSGNGLLVLSEVFFPSIPFMKIASYVANDIFIVNTPGARGSFLLSCEGYQLQKIYHDESKTNFASALRTAMPLVQRSLTKEALECLK